MTGSASARQPIPRSQINTFDYAVEDRFEVWREFDKVVSDIQPNAQGHRDPEAWAIQWQLGSIAVSKKGYGPHRCSRGADDRQLKWNEYVRLRLYESGSVTGLYGDTPMSLRAGQIHLSDLSLGFRTASARQQHITILFPYDTLGYDPSRHPRQVVVSTATPHGQMLEVAMRSLAEQMDSVTSANANALAQGITGLVRGMLLANGADDGARAQIEVAQQTAMRRYIDEHLEDLNLNVETLCGVFHASRATVYRHFGEVGGVSRYVKERRLDRAFHELATQPAARGRVRAVAERWGFFEAGHFNRLFRQRFGLSPSDVAALGEASGDAQAFDPASAMTLASRTSLG